MTGNSQKFIARNRAPRVQIEYDVELYGSEKKVQLPFVMGVMSDLAGKSKVPQPSIDDRSFLEIDVDNFDDRMRAMAPRAAFSVPNTLTGEGNVAVDLTFEKMDDFSPAAIAAKVDSLRPLLEARTQLSDLMAYMDGKAGAESLIEKILADPALLSAVSASADSSADPGSALDSLRALTPDDVAEEDTTSDVLADLKASAPEDAPEQDLSGDVLASLADQVVEDTPDDDIADVTLKGLRAAAPEDAEPDTRTQDTLAALAENALQAIEVEDVTSGVLNSLAAVDLPEEAEDNTDELLAGLADAAVEPEEETDNSDDLLADLAANAPDEVQKPDTVADALDSIADVTLPEVEEDTTDALLADLAESAPQADVEHDATSDALDSLSDIELPDEEKDTTDDLLADLANDVPDTTPESDALGDALNSLADVDLPTEVEDTTDALLVDLAESAPQAEVEPDTTTNALESLADFGLPDEEEDTTDELLADLAGEAPEPEEESNALSDAFDSLAEIGLPEEDDETDTDALLADLADATADDSEQDSGALDEALDSLGDIDQPEEVADNTDDLLAELAGAEPNQSEEIDASDDILADLTEDTAEDTAVDDLDDLLGDLGGDADDTDPLEAEVDESSDLDDLLGDLGDENDIDLDGLLEGSEEDETSEIDNLLSVSSDDSTSDLDELLGDLGGDEGDALEAGGEEPSDLDDLLGDLGGDETTNLDDLVGESKADGTGDLDDLLAELGDDSSETDELPVVSDDEESSDLEDLLSGATSDDTNDLDDLLGDLGGGDNQDTESKEPSDLDDLLGDLGGDDDLSDLLGDSSGVGENDLDNLLGDLGEDSDSDLDDLLGDLDDTADTAEATMSEEPEFAYGQMSAERPEPQKLNRKRFRLAIMGDFSGRAAQGRLETGDALAARRSILLDPDTAEDVIEGFATELILPIGKDGAGVAIKLGGLDDLHPDELYENVDLFSELVGLRGQLSSGATAENAAKQLREWGEKHGQHVAPTQSHSSGNTVRADYKLSDFQKLIGDTTATLTQASPLDDLMARIVGPHIRAIPDADAMAMQGAVDEALSAAMRLVLHHPEFQSIEAQWRSIDLIARSIETDDTLDVVLYDISAEEIAADLVSSDDLAQSGFARLLTEEPLDEENGRGGYSALIGLYTFEETPPHAELLGRIARLAAHVDAPFITAITPGFLDTPKADRHKLVSEAWDTLRSMPEAGHLGLVSPRFLLRRPYGAKSEPIYEFEFEEFTRAEGLKGMLWANPVVLVAILLAKSFREHGASMSLGSIMSLGEMPYHYVDDQYGDQVALPCTERNLTLDKIEMAVTRGIMSVASIKGRDEIRLTSFGSLAGGEILGPWTGAPPPKPSPPKPEPAGNALEELDSDVGSGDDMDLDDLLADFGDDPDLGGDDDDTDAELAALLGDL